MDEALKEALEPGEALVESRGLHGSLLVLPVFFLLLGLFEFSPWAFGASSSALVGGVALAYGAFTMVIFLPLYRHGRVGLTDRRVVYLQRFPMGKSQLQAWPATGFDAVMVRRGLLGSVLGYGHLMLLKSGRLVTVIRSVRDLNSLVPRIERELLGKPSA